MTRAGNDARLSLDYVSVEDLNAALRVFRRLPLELESLEYIADSVTDQGLAAGFERLNSAAEAIGRLEKLKRLIVQGCPTDNARLPSDTWRLPFGFLSRLPKALKVPSDATGCLCMHM